MKLLQWQACNTIRGVYTEECRKLSYATETLAAGALSQLQARGRSEKSYYQCKTCGTFHLSSRAPENQYELEAVHSVDVNGTRISVARRVSSASTDISLCIRFTTKDGNERRSVYRLSKDQATSIVDGFISALYDNTDPEHVEEEDAAA